MSCMQYAAVEWLNNTSGAEQAGYVLEPSFDRNIALGLSSKYNSVCLYTEYMG